MPGSISDSYDPEFSTRANAHDVSDAISEIRDVIGKTLGDELKPIVGVVQGPQGKLTSFRFSERERRILRFALNRALESI